MSDLVGLAEELRRLRVRLDRVEAQEHSHGQYLLGSGASAGAVSQAQVFTRQVYAPDFLPAVSAEADSQRFDAGVAGAPAGWTEVAAATSSSQAQRLGYWFLSANAATGSWSYRRQAAALAGSGAYNSFALGPLYFRDGRWSGDLTYRFGIYADNAGTPNLDVFVRSVLTWDAAAAVWKTRGERKNGTTQTDGAWYTLYQVPLVQPLWLRVMLRTTATIQGRAYVGGTAVYNAHTLLQDANANYTWGQPWLLLEMASRPASGVDAYFYAGGLNRTGDV